MPSKYITQANRETNNKYNERGIKEARTNIASSKKYITDENVFNNINTVYSDAALSDNGRGSNQDNYPTERFSIPDQVTNIKKELGILQNQSDSYRKFNVFRNFEGEDIFNSGIGYVFMTKPDLYLYDVGDDRPNLEGNFERGKYIFREFLKNYSINGVEENLWERFIVPSLCARSGLSTDLNNGFFIPIITNYALGFELKDTVLTSTEKGENLIGQKLRYARHFYESENVGELSINFFENQRLLITLLHKVWIDYMHYIRTGYFRPRLSNINNRVIDYQSSIYFILCEMDGINIRFWSKYTGVFPTSLPYGQFSWKQGDNSRRDVTISYEYSFKEDMDPYILTNDFNKVSGFDNSLNYKDEEGYEENKEVPFQLSNNWCSFPFIDYSSKPYKLKWANRGDLINKEDSNFQFATQYNSSAKSNEMNLQTYFNLKLKNLKLVTDDNTGR